MSRSDYWMIALVALLIGFWGWLVYTEHVKEQAGKRAAVVDASLCAVDADMRACVRILNNREASPEIKKVAGTLLAAGMD